MNPLLCIITVNLNFRGKNIVSIIFNTTASEYGLRRKAPSQWRTLRTIETPDFILLTYWRGIICWPWQWSGATEFRSPGSYTMAIWWCHHLLPWWLPCWNLLAEIQHTNTRNTGNWCAHIIRLMNLLLLYKHPQSQFWEHAYKHGGAKGNASLKQLLRVKGSHTCTQRKWLDGNNTGKVE